MRRLNPRQPGVSRAAVSMILAALPALLLTAATACAAAPGARPDGSPARPTTSTATLATPTATPPSASVAALMVPKPDHVVIVIFENKNVDQVLGSGQAPFLDELAQTGVDFINAHAEVHPSQPNYLALFSGRTLG